MATHDDAPLYDKDIGTDFLPVPGARGTVRRRGQHIYRRGIGGAWRTIIMAANEQATLFALTLTHKGIEETTMNTPPHGL